MKISISVAGLGIALVAVLAMPAKGGPILPGNLVVVRAGTGATAINGNAHAAFLEEFTPTGVSVQTIPLPTADLGANQTLTLSGSATSEGFLTQSTNNQYLTMAGYDAAPGTVTPQSSSASAVNRVIGRIEISTGDIDTTTALNDAYDTSNIRSVVSTNGNDLWLGGNGVPGTSAGVRYTTFGATTSTRINTSGDFGSNRRVVNIFNGQLYVSGSSIGGPNLAVSSIGTGTPTSPTSETYPPGFPTSGLHSAYDFWFKDIHTLYIADDGSAANGGGIQKWTESGGTWSLAYTLLNNGTTTTPARGLAGYIDDGSGNIILFATTGTGTNANTLITLTDLGPSSVATVVAIAPINTAFRGVEYIQLPEPAGLGLLALSGLMFLRRGR